MTHHLRRGTITAEVIIVGRALTPEERRELLERRKKEALSTARALGFKTAEENEAAIKAAAEEAQEKARNDTLTKEEFQELVESLAGQFETDMFRTEFRQAAVKRRREWADGDTISLRETIMLDFEGMKKSEEYMK